MKMITQSHIVSVALPSDVFAPGSARRFVLETLTSWGLQAHAGDAVLIVSELATNAVRHGGASMRLLVSHDDGMLWLELWDASFSPPVPRSASLDNESGRGLTIVETLAHEFGWQPEPDGKTVYAGIMVSR